MFVNSRTPCKSAFIASRWSFIFKIIESVLSQFLLDHFFVIFADMHVMLKIFAHSSHSIALFNLSAASLSFFFSFFFAGQPSTFAITSAFWDVERNREKRIRAKRIAFCREIHRASQRHRSFIWLCCYLPFLLPRKSIQPVPNYSSTKPFTTLPAGACFRFIFTFSIYISYHFFALHMYITHERFFVLLHSICSSGSSKNGIFSSPHLSLILNYVLYAPSSGLCSQWPGWSSKALEQRTRLILAQYFSHLATVAVVNAK